MKMLNQSNLFHCIILTIGIFFINQAGLLSQQIDPPCCYGGNKLLREFIKEEMIYPGIALRKNVEGTVKFSFIVEPDAQVSNLQIVQSVSPEIDKEATRLFNKILWHPPTDLGKPIALSHSLAIKFSIKKYNKLIKERGYEYFTYPYQPIDTGFHVYELKQLDDFPKPIFGSEDINFNTFMARNLKYPETAFKQNISGKVKLKFVVEQSGRISNITIVNTLGGGTTEEAIRVIKLMKWHPGIYKGKAVRSFTELEIKFDIAKKTVGGSIPSK